MDHPKSANESGITESCSSVSSGGSSIASSSALQGEEEQECCKTVIWDESAESCHEEAFQTVYSIRLDLQRQQQDEEDVAFLARVSVSAHPRREALLGEENVDRLVYSFLPPSPEISYLQAVILVPSDASGGIISSQEEEEEENLLVVRKTLFDDQGRLAHDRLQNVELALQQEGPFVGIETMEVHPDHQGKNLGLRMLDELLQFLLESTKLPPWAIAALLPTPTPKIARQWNDNRNKISNVRKKAPSVYESTRTLAHYFSRMGFRQASRDRQGSHAMFLTRNMYFDSRPTSFPLHRLGKPGVQSTDRWIRSPNSAPFLYIPTTLTSKSPTTTDDKNDQFRQDLHFAIYRWNQFQDGCRSVVVEFQQALDAVERLHAERQAAYEALKTAQQKTKKLRDSMSSWEKRLGFLTPPKIRSSEQRVQLQFSLAHLEINKSQNEVETLREAIDSAAVELRIRTGMARRHGQHLFEKLLPWDRADPTAAASINECFALHTIVAQITTSGVDMSPVETLIRMGGSVDALDMNRQSPLHVAAEHGKHFVITFLLARGANPRQKDVHGKTPLDLLLDQHRRTWHFYQATGRSNVMGVEDERKGLRRSIKSLIVHDIGNTVELIGGWLTPRMWIILRNTAEREQQKLVKLCRLLSSRADDFLLVHEILRDTHCLFYSPLAPPITNQVALHLLHGYELIWSALYTLLSDGIAPTVLNVCSFISRAPKQQQTDLLRFEEAGGKIEQVVLALVDIGRNAWKDPKSVMEANNLPIAPIDGIFDIPEIMCIDVPILATLPL